MAACATAWLGVTGACVERRGARAPPPSHYIHAALLKLASATEPEAPRALLAWLPRERDALCGDARDERLRLWCHLERARVQLVPARAGGACRVVIELPSLSDHVHAVEVVREGDRLVGVRVDSAN